MSVTNVSVRRLTTCGLLVAVGVVLGGLLKIPVTLFGTYALKLSFGLVPIIMASVLYGPVYGGMCAALYDMLGALLFPVGGYNPAFTLVTALLGVIPGLFFLRSRHITPLRLLLAVAVSQLTGSVVLNTALLMLFYGSPAAIFITRLLTQAIMVPALTALCYLLLRALSRSAARLGALPLIFERNQQ